MAPATCRTAGRAAFAVLLFQDLMVAPLLETLAVERAGKVKVVKVNVDENRSLAQRHGIMSLPTMVFFTNGEAGEKLIGFMPKDTIKAKLKL